MVRPSGKITVGVLSDTHGLLRPQVTQALQGVHQIIHAGDVGSTEVLETLRQLAPLTVVQGNMDYDLPWRRLPREEVVQIGAHNVLVLHDLERLDLDPEAAGISVVISGHTHRPHVAQEGRVLFLNPGSAGPRRHPLPVTVALLTLQGEEIRGEVLELDC